MTAKANPNVCYLSEVLGIHSILVSKELAGPEVQWAAEQQKSMKPNAPDNAVESDAARSDFDSSNIVRAEIENADLSPLHPQIFLVGPTNPSQEASELLSKMVSAIKDIDVQAVDVDEFKSLGGNHAWALVFGQKLFVDLGGNEFEFFDHLNKPVNLNDSQVYSSHDLQDMVGSGSQVTSLKKQVWLQIKNIVKKVESLKQ